MYTKEQVRKVAEYMRVKPDLSGEYDRKKAQQYAYDWHSIVMRDRWSPNKDAETSHRYNVLMQMLKNANK